MRRFLALGFLLAAAGAQTSPRSPHLRNAEIVDREGVATSLVGLHQLSGEGLFRGFLGDATIEVPYARVREFDVHAPERPGGRMRANLLLTTGKRIEATFGEREGDGILQGFAWFGRLDIYFRDLRRVRFLDPTRREDRPSYGPPSDNIEAVVQDGQGVVTKLTHFRRAVGENVVSGILGASRITIPTRLMQRLELSSAKPGARGLAVKAVLRGGRSLTFTLPPYEERTVYRGRASFGSYRIQLSKVRSIEITRVSLPLRELRPLDIGKIRRAGETEKSEIQSGGTKDRDPDRDPATEEKPRR